MKNKKKSFGGLGQLTIPVIALCLLVIFNLVRDMLFIYYFKDPNYVSFFSIELTKNNLDNMVLAGNLISIINGASELAILAMGMTLVTAACGGQDISVGAAAAIAGSVFVKIIKMSPWVNGIVVLFAFVCACIVAMIFGSFNGTLVAIFKIQPMIATLILYTCILDQRRCDPYCQQPDNLGYRKLYPGYSHSHSGAHSHRNGDSVQAFVQVHGTRTVYTVCRYQSERCQT